MIDHPDLLSDDDIRRATRLLRQVDEEILTGRSCMALSMLVGVGGYIMALLSRQPQMFCEPDLIMAGGTAFGTGGFACSRWAAHATGQIKAAVTPLQNLIRDFGFLHAGLYDCDRLKDLGIDLDTMDFSAACTAEPTDEQIEIDSTLYRRISQAIKMIHHGIDLLINIF